MAFADPGEGGQLLGHLLRFARLLRVMGVRVNLSQVLDWVRALEVVPISDKGDFYFAARALLVARHEDYPLFDQAFRLYWQEPRPFAVGGAQPRPGPQRRARLPALTLGASGTEAQEEEEVEARRAYSAEELLRHKDFSQMSWEEVEAAKQIIAGLRWPIPARATRRTRRATRGHAPDLRRIVRENLRYGGEPLRLHWRRAKTRPRPLVLLCDISGSMERYARMMLHFAHALSQRWGRVESFTFGTRLTRVTHHLRHRDVDDALREVGSTVEDWSGGTRIGEAIKRFNYDWARRVLGRGAVLLIISDGLDRGETDELAHEMARLQRTVFRLIWLNPLLGSPDYEPIQRGMAAALPYIDDFRPIHNLASMAQLATVLATLPPRRPARRQRPR